MSKADIRDYLVVPNSLYFDANAVKSYYDSLVDDTNAVSVISSERLSGHPHSGGYDSKEIADRLNQVFPDSKVLIVIREQKSAIASCYLQYVKFGGPCSIKDYLKPPQRGLPVIPLFNFDHFNYYKLVEYYIKLFGRDNVLILPYEEFKNDAKGFCAGLSTFAGAKVVEELPFSKVTNRRVSTISSTMARHINKLFSKTRLNPAALDLAGLQNGLIKPFIFLDTLMPSFLHKHFDKKFKKIIEAQVSDRYKEGNMKLSELLDMDLAAYGYEL